MVAWHRNLQPATDSASWFSSRNTITSSADGAQSVVVADMDGDSRPDVVASSQLDDTIAWYRNGAATGASTSFTEHVITNAAEEALSLELADLNGDGRLEILSASEDDDSIAWFANLGGGNPASLFGARQILVEGVRNAKSVVGADLDGDGRVDVLSLSPDDDTIAWSPNPVSLQASPALSFWPVACAQCFECLNQDADSAPADCQRLLRRAVDGVQPIVPARPAAVLGRGPAFHELRHSLPGRRQRTRLPDRRWPLRKPAIYR